MGLCLARALTAGAQPAVSYVANRTPLRQNPYIQLPLGAIQPQGWLREMLIRQKNGATGNLDKLYPLVMGVRNGWRGGNGDQWERGPYWLDGLVPLAYILHDQTLINKFKPFIEWTLNSQQPDGYFGPAKDYPYEAGVQRDNSHDWWPKMVMLKVLQQYYEATQDKRVIKLMTNYFRYQLKELPQHPLDHWTFWARYRGGDNLMVVYWLYNLTGDKFLLDLGDLIHKQTFDYTNAFLNTDLLAQNGSIHGVNLAEGMKDPIIYYQHHPEAQYLNATVKSYQDLRKYDETANGMFGGDEALHGNNPTQGSELCSAVELMFTLENTLQITGSVDYADHLERIAFNTLPTQISDDFMQRQYFQQANQVMLTRHDRNFDVNHDGTDLCYGLLTGYACCTSNMHQGWPKFAQNLWYATPDRGLAALLYSPSKVKAYVAGGTEVMFNEETNYPFDETVKFTLSTGKKAKAVAFPFSLRVPQWCTRATVKINGKEEKQGAAGETIRIERQWHTGDVVELSLPMHIAKSHWTENTVAIERGPVVYALKMGEQTQQVHNTLDTLDYGTSYFNVLPATPWNYGLIETPDNKLNQQYQFKTTGKVAGYPWNLQNAPVIITTKAKRIPQWQLYDDMTGPLPYMGGFGFRVGPEEEITLVPYGCTQLRITEFPQVPAK